MLDNDSSSAPTQTLNSSWALPALPTLPYGRIHPLSLQILHPKKVRALHFFGSRHVILPGSNERQAIKRQRGEEWFGPANVPPDETNLLNNYDAAQQRYGVLRDNIRSYILVFSRGAWALKSSESDIFKRR